MHENISRHYLTKGSGDQNGKQDLVSKHIYNPKKWQLELHNELADGQENNAEELIVFLLTVHT